ncbi:18593_t:CDS:1, partial [Entrophospora sp. SA101]
NLAICPILFREDSGVLPTKVEGLVSPPRAKRKKGLPNASAMIFAKEVLPTPGGPTKQKIGNFRSIE